MQELDNAAHILSIGYVHRHRPFADEYDIGDAIGTGGFAVVRKATHRATGQTYAVKTLRVKAGGGGSDSDSSCDDSSDDDSSDASGDSDEGGGGSGRKLAAMSMAEMTNELIMMQQLSEHPNIVTVKEFYTEDAEGHVTSAVTPASVSGDAVDEKGERSPETHGVVHVVMELLQGQELVDAIVEHGTYQESDAKIVMSNMLDAIAFMHARGVVHRDLKLENLVLARPDNLESVTLVDFGLAKALMARERAENVCGTLAYVAPEALAAGVYGQGVDVWALGVASTCCSRARGRSTTRTRTNSWTPSSSATWTSTRGRSGSGSPRRRRISFAVCSNPTPNTGSPPRRRWNTSGSPRNPETPPRGCTTSTRASTRSWGPRGNTPNVDSDPGTRSPPRGNPPRKARHHRGGMRGVRAGDGAAGETGRSNEGRSKTKGKPRGGDSEERESVFGGAGVEVDGGGQDGGPSARVRAQGREVGDGARLSTQRRIRTRAARTSQAVGETVEARGEGGEGTPREDGYGTGGWVRILRTRWTRHERNNAETVSGTKAGRDGDVADIVDVFPASTDVSLVRKCYLRQKVLSSKILVVPVVSCAPGTRRIR